ncbi:hypothetical protein J2128_001936 [Methanomicrobium sp. W14]|uniref:hypothetical protein n=1 Tax=Methanomicrobium sp. W14 TaxID=2817839 RepID=UPI001AE72315|nr:hypothetical protein [Methanomicrobium sp. W14]MBP2133970.1 hypothetical protein [Methanomicrobium sp. W14]
MTEIPGKNVNIPVAVGLSRILLSGVYKSTAKISRKFSEICSHFSKRRDARHGDQPKKRQIGAILTEDERCTDCPLNYAKFERDALSYVIVDKIFRNLLLLLAEAGKCGLKKDNKSPKNKRSVFIKSENMTFQLGLDAVVIYSSSPGDLSEIGEWIRNNLAAYYLNIDSLVYRVTNPCFIFRNECAVDIIDPGRIKIIQTLLKKNDFSLVNVYFSSKNEVLPHLKIYNKDRAGNKRLRIEFVCFNNFQVSSVIPIRDELLNVLNNLYNDDQAFLSYIQKYYPREIELKVLNLITQLKEKITNLDDKFESFTGFLKKEFSELKVNTENTEQIISPEIDEKINAVTDEVNEKTSVEVLYTTISKVFEVSQNASKVFLAYIEREYLNESKSIRRQIKIGSVTDVFRTGKVKDPVLSQRKPVIACTEELVRAGLFQEMSGNQLKISAAGEVLKEKILVKRGETVDNREERR